MHPQVIRNFGIKKYRGKGSGYGDQGAAVKACQAQVFIKRGIIDKVGMKTQLPVLVNTYVPTVVQGGLGA